MVGVLESGAKHLTGAHVLKSQEPSPLRIVLECPDANELPAYDASYEYSETAILSIDQMSIRRK